MSVKAFELIPCLSKGNFLPNPRCQVTSIECCGKNLYIGTDDCTLVHFLFEEVANQNGRPGFRFQRQSGRNFQNKKPIAQLKAASALNRILMLCDFNVVLLNMLDLEVTPNAGRVKGVTSFCLNENPPRSDPFSVQICAISKKRGVQLFSITEDRVSLVKDIHLTDPAVTVGIDGSFVCVATTTEYKIINYETSGTQELFPYDTQLAAPLVTRITREEFLLAAPGALGMFANTTGISQRPPLQWNNNLVAVTYTHPYILALNDEFITVHSILDQQQKQSVPFSGGRLLGEFDGKLFVSRDRDLYALVPIPVEKQIQALLTDKRVKEALDLAKNATNIGFSRDKFQKMYERIQQQAGFIELSELHFEDAAALFMAGRLDVRELIALFPGLLSQHSTFMKSVPPLHEIPDMVILTRGDADKLLHFKQFLVSYLEQAKTVSHTQHCLMEMDTALLKLYAECSSPQLVVLITTSPHHISIDDVQATLQKQEKHHALALLCQGHGEPEKALQIWTEIVDEKRTDNTFPGLQFVVEFLANINDTDLVLRYSDWALSKDEEIGVKMFTERPQGEDSSERLLPGLVVDLLAKYPTAALIYLEHLVYKRNTQNEKFHTHLAVLYLDQVTSLLHNTQSSRTDIDLARSKLRHLLQTSDLYRTQLLLSKIKDSSLHAELAILYGKMEEHDKALRLLVHQLNDFGAAENYCLVTSQNREPAYRRKLFHSLLAIYLDPANEKREYFVTPTIALLNKNKEEFDPLKVLHLLPENWSVGLLSHFLTHCVRNTLHGSRQARLERMLSKTHNVHTKHTALQARRRGLQLTEDRKCQVCRQPFTEAACVRYPNDVVAHPACSPSQHTCPVTGKLFRSVSQHEPAERTALTDSKTAKS